MNTTQHDGRVYALLADGTTVEIRPAGPDDFDAVRAMHQAMSPDNSYMRFFNLSRLTADIEARRIARPPEPGRLALLALCGAEVVGVASYAAPAGQPGTAPGEAEVAFAVADHMHHRGIATLLLEHLVSAARSRHITTFTAQTLTENTPMLRVFADAGLPVQRRFGDGVIELCFPLPDGTGMTLDGYLDVVANREGRADAASLRHVFAPASVAVVGASRRPGTVGRAILDNIRKGGYAGPVYAVNSRAREVSGEPSLASVLDLPGPVDLAVIAVPPPDVLGVVEQCGQRGVRSVVVITSGLDDAASADVLAACRRHGMRLVGPDCFGVSVPALGLDATFGDRPPRPGVAGLVTQSGGLGFAMVDQLSRLDIGISSFASVGAKLDVSSNDMLLWWEHDGTTRLAVLYIESYGNPRKFARTARRVGASMPVLIVDAGRSAAGQRGADSDTATAYPAATSYTAAAASPVATRQALFEQAGIIATRGYGELMEATALLATQPVPAGRTVAIVSNVGGAGVLTADACSDLGLAVYHPRGAARDRLSSLVPGGGAVTGPVDTTAGVSAADFRQILELTAADDEVDALIVLMLATGATGDLVQALQQADITVPVAAVVLNQPESVRLIPRARAQASTDQARADQARADQARADQASADQGTNATESIPAYGYPEAAVGAMARAAAYGAWRTEPRGQVPAFPDADTARARALVREFLDAQPGGGWLPPQQTAALLRSYRVPLAELTEVRDEDAAVSAAAAAAGPVVLKAGITGPARKSEAGAVELDLRTEADVRAAHRALSSRFADAEILLQPMITGGVEVIAGVADDRMFGPLVIFGLGGVATNVLADHAARLTPLTDTDADKLIRSIRSAPLLLGHGGAPAADLGALRDLLLRIARLADDVPEVAELDLNPVIARPDGVLVVDARIKAEPVQPQDPFLRRLR